MLPSGYEKKSFRKFDFAVDLKSLEKDYLAISDEDWAASYWGHVHCSVGMLLLRGGNSGTEQDFFCDEVYDSPLLARLPYIRYLIGEEGPFGKANYAFIFRLEPNGITLKHQDLMEKWKDMYRIHVPIYTNPGAYLIANGLSQHFSKGSAWSFDNHSDHGVVNGDSERVHLIFDVEHSDKMAACIDEAELLPGQAIPGHEQTISQKSRTIPSYPGDVVMKNAITTLRTRGVNDTDIAKFFNAKGIPSKSYPVRNWTEEMVVNLGKNQN